MTKVEFLRARLAEVEQLALAVEDRSAPWDGQWEADGEAALRTRNGHVLAYGHGQPPRPFKPGLLAHIVRHDPAHVLRDVQAMRKMLDALEHGLGEWDVAWLAESVLCGWITAYDDHPDYREEWRP